MASGDAQTLLLARAEERGNLGDGFDSIRVLFPTDPDAIAEEKLDEVETALQLAPDLRLRSPLMGGGMSIAPSARGLGAPALWPRALWGRRWIPARGDIPPFTSSMKSGTPWTWRILW